MLKNCSIVSINQLLYVTCEACGGKVTRLGSSRAVVQQRKLAFLEGPDFIRRQQELHELKVQTLQAALNFYCTKCNTHEHCHRTFMVKFFVYCASQEQLMDLVMFDEAASQFFGCNADEFVALSRNDKTLMQRLEDYLTETTWDIKLQYKKKKLSDKIAALVPSLNDGSQRRPLIPYLSKIPHSSSLVLDSSLSPFF